MQSTSAPDQIVRYVHAGSVTEARWHSNGHTLLDHLREERKLRGTKEGCAEGDCGACVVVIGEMSGQRDTVVYRAVNACLFPMSALDGKLLITVEDLSSPGSELHPVQRAMVECHASQCGFCTPGFVMSLYAHYLNHEEPVPQTRMHDVLAGNLCRCTGYAPILRAARRMYDYPRTARDVESDLRLLATLDHATDTAKVLAARDEVAFSPRSLEEMARLYLENPDAVLVAGSTDVGLWITKQKRTLKKVIHLKKVDEMRQTAAVRGRMSIGASVPLSDALKTIVGVYPEFEELAARFASLPVRNAATLGGNIGNGSPIGDSMPALIAANAIVRLRQGATTRELPLEDFYLGYQKKDLRCGEFIESVHLPARAPETYVRAYKVSKRLDDDISAVCCALAIRLSEGRCVSVRIAYGGMAAMPRRAMHAERALHGRPLDRQGIEHAIAALKDDFQPMSDHRATAWYRSEVAGNLLRRAVEEHSAEAATRVVSYVGALQ